MCFFIKRGYNKFLNIGKDIIVFINYEKIVRKKRIKNRNGKIE